MLQIFFPESNCKTSETAQAKFYLGSVHRFVYLIPAHTKINKGRKKFQEDQNTLIEYEIQKIINLVEFVKPKK